ncbi:MAG: MFS transporter [Rhizomicrobium sp.]
MNARSPETAVTNKLPNWLLAPFASAAMPVAALGIPLTVYLPNYYASHIGLSLAAVGAAFSIVRLIDIIFDPLIGVAINATHTRFGRFRPWMVAGAPLLMIATYMIFMAEPGVSTSYMVSWLLVLYAGFSMLTLGHSAWAAALVPEYHQRSRVYGWMQAIGVVAVMVVLTVPAVMASVWHKSTAEGVQAMGWFVIAITPFTVLLCAFVVGEPKQVEVRHRVTLRDYWTMLARPSLLRILASDLALALGPAITAALYIFFFTQGLGFTRTQATVLLLIYIAAGLPGAPVWAVVARRLGKHQTVMLGCVLYGFAQVLVFVMPHGNMATMIPGMFFAGFVVSCFTFLIRAMVADISDEVRLEMGKDRAALLYGLITSTSKVGSTLSVVTTFSILAVFGFNAKEGVVNTGVPLDALVACYVIVPVLTMFVGAAALWGYKLDQESHDGIREQLATRDAIAGAAGVTESLTGSEPPMGAAPALQVAAGD